MKSSNDHFQTCFISSNHVSHLVSKLNKLDSRSDPRKYLCPNCGRLFRHMGRLRAHMLTHSRNQSYSCGICGKTLENWKKLWQHQRVHRQWKGRFTCPVCGQGFRFVGSYKGHMKKHPDYTWIQERPSKVSYGQQSSSLPYECEECSSSFETLDFLFSHQICHLSIDETTANFDNDSVKDFQREHHKVYCYQSQSTPTNSMCRKQVPLVAPQLPGSDLIQCLSHSQLSKTVKLSSPSLLFRDVMSSHDNNEGIVFGKQSLALV
ncbi:zinc finger Y-chromosomal protein-like [Aplochiton taeniatus]